VQVGTRGGALERGFEQQILHKLLANFECLSTLVNGTQLQLTKFFTIFHYKFAMPPKSKIVSLEKLDNFYIGRF
jgi:hypothetical protein